MKRHWITRTVGWLSWIAVFVFLLVFTACGGKHGNLTLNMVTGNTPAGFDVFHDAASVRFTVIDSSHVTTVPVTNGAFTYKVSQPPNDSKVGTITVETLDASGNVTGRGVTPPITVTATDQTLSVFVGKVGVVSPLDAYLKYETVVTASDGTMTLMDNPLPLYQTSAVDVPGLGIVIAGGRGTDGKAVANTEVYSVYTQGVIQAASLTTARAAGALVYVGSLQSAVFGGSSGGDPFVMPVNTTELFDPTVSTVGAWSPVTGDPFDARSFASTAVLPSGATLISGGADANGTALASAATLNASGTIRLTAVMAPMQAPRLHHAVAGAKFPDGDGAIVYGGLAAGSTGPVVERMVNQSFTAYDVGALENRLYATATTLPSGDVLVLGGVDATGNALRSGYLISPKLPSATVTPLPMALSVPRARHTATLTGNDLVVCGGVSQTNDLSPAALATDSSMKTCDILDATTYGIKSSPTLHWPRYDIAAAALETGAVLLAGGIYQNNGQPSPVLEMYQP